jgi:hypothetical protein
MVKEAVFREQDHVAPQRLVRSVFICRRAPFDFTLAKLRDALG